MATIGLFRLHVPAVREDKGRLDPSRTIDIDLVDFGGQVINTPELTLPHPQAHLRPFVQEPLKELGIQICRG